MQKGFFPLSQLVCSSQHAATSVPACSNILDTYMNKLLMLILEVCLQHFVCNTLLQIQLFISTKCSGSLNVLNLQKVKSGMKLQTQFFPMINWLNCQPAGRHHYYDVLKSDWVVEIMKSLSVWLFSVGMRATIIFYNKAGKQKIDVVYKQIASASLETGQVTLDLINDCYLHKWMRWDTTFLTIQSSPVTINKPFTVCDHFFC